MLGLGVRAVAALAVVAVAGQSITDSISTITGSNTDTLGPGYPTGSDVSYNTNTIPSSLQPTYTYVTGSTTLTRTVASAVVADNSTRAANSTQTSLTSSTTGGTILSGTYRPTSTSIEGTAGSNSTRTRTSGAPAATNTTPCNGYPELCNRKFSNITMVAAHNSPFVRPGNVASNQYLDVTTQLDDGIRMLQFQVHKPNASSPLLLCHTSCDLLNAGTLLAYLTTVRKWLEDHRYDVITILMGNQDFVAPGNFSQPVIDSGLIDYVYTPPTAPMNIDAWPTLAEMILTNTRVVFMLDYEADQSEIPWLLDEFSYVWETPFSPTDREFPCTPQRPPSETDEVYAQRMFIANHNLNIDLSIAGLNLLVPATNLLNETNAVSGYGSAGWAVSNCTTDWNRPPNYLLVDYYNVGNFNGSTLAVAAAANNVTWNADSCCGSARTSAALRVTAAGQYFWSIVATIMVTGYAFI